MLVKTFRDGQNLSGMENSRLWDAPAKRATNGGESDLIRTMCSRIVVLEQQYREQSVKMDQMTEEMGRLMQLKHCDGVLVWRIEQFHSKVDSMGNNPNVLLYSTEAFTSPQGYKFCARLNISPKVRLFFVQSR